MNRSGRAVQEAANWPELAASDITVFQDRLELPPAKVRVKVGGGIAGHELRSISSHIGNDYRRVRSGSVIPASRSWCTATCCRISPRATGRGCRRCARRLPTMPACSRPGATRRFQNKVHLAMQAKRIFEKGDDGAA